MPHIPSPFVDNARHDQLVIAPKRAINQQAVALRQIGQEMGFDLSEPGA